MAQASATQAIRPANFDMKDDIPKFTFTQTTTVVEPPADLNKEPSSFTKFANNVAALGET